MKSIRWYLKAAAFSFALESRRCDGSRSSARGGQGKIVADILGDRAVGFVDDHARHSPVGTLPLLGRIADLPSITHDAIIVAIGDNRTRRAITDRLAADGERLATVSIRVQ